MEQAGLDQGARVVVVGAGIVGASIAYHLSERGMQVTVVEAGEPGSGASGHSFAWINSTFGKEPRHYHDFNRRSMDMWDRFARRLGRDIGLHWGGELRAVSTERDAEELRAGVKQLQGWGYKSRIISPEEMRALEPGLVCDDFVLGEFSENDGRVDPPKVIDACLGRARTRGTQLMTGTPVTGFRLGADGVESVLTDNGDVPCDAIVLAAGVEVTRLAAMAGVDVPRQESPGVVIRTDPRPRVIQTASVLHVPGIDEVQQEIHLRQNEDGTLLIGEGTQESLARDDGQEHADELLSRAIHYLPALEGATAIRVPVGYRPMPLDGHPVLGFTRQAPNLYIAFTHSGVTLAPVIGEMASIEIVDGARVDLLEPYRLERFEGR